MSRGKSKTSGTAASGGSCSQGTNAANSVGRHTRLGARFMTTTKWSFHRLHVVKTMMRLTDK